MKTKLKKFMEEHKKGVAIAAGIGTTVLGGIVGYKLCKVNLDDGFLVTNQNMISVFENAVEKGLQPSDILTGIYETPLKPADLGELGKLAIGLGASENQEFTHFIAFGKHMDA